MTHPAQPETLDLHSHDIAEDKKQELLRLFPEICTEGGTIAFERLKLALGDMVDVGKERSLNLSEFVEGRSWHRCERVGIAEAPVFSRNWLSHRQKIRSASARFYALQSVIN